MEELKADGEKTVSCGPQRPLGSDEEISNKMQDFEKLTGSQPVVWKRNCNKGIDPIPTDTKLMSPLIQPTLHRLTLSSPDCCRSVHTPVRASACAPPPSALLSR